MNPIVGKLLVWVGDQHACVRVTGRANFAISVEFRKLLEHLRQSGHSRVVLDLSECQLMDSTFLGVLAHEAQKLCAGNDPGDRPLMELVNANPTVRQLIEDLGIARLFRFTECDHTQTKFEDAPAPAAPDPTELKRTSLEAHELLMALHPDNVAKFKDVARFLAQELKKKPQSPPAASP